MRMIAMVTVVLLCGGVAWATPAQPAPKPALAVLGLEVVGPVSPEAVRVAQELAAGWRLRAKAGGPYSLAPGGDRELASEKQANQCASELPVCMAVIGKNLGADFVLYGKLERRTQGGTAGYRVTLKLLEVAKAGVAVVWTDFVPDPSAKGAALEEWGRGGYRKLVGCDFAALVLRGDDRAQTGMNAAALVSYEEALACKRDDQVTSKAYLVACKSKHAAKAKLHYQAIPAARQSTLLQVCLRYGIDPTR